MTVARNGDGRAPWLVSAYVRPLGLERPSELGVLVHRWRYRDLRRLAAASSGTPLALVNPGLAAPARTTRTLTCAVTHLEPGAWRF
jgi:hypothetical protein